MHDETPDISIVVPVYNTERFLPACLESIDIQGTGSFEVILVDDGSTDGSPEICDAYCDKRERVFVRRVGVIFFRSTPMTLFLKAASKRYAM